MAGRTETFMDNCQTLPVNCLAVNHVDLPFVARWAQKKGIRSTVKQIKYVRCFLCRSLVFCPACPYCCSKSAGKGKTVKVLENLGRPRDQLQGHKNHQRCYTLPFCNQPTLTRSPIIRSAMYIPSGTDT